MLADTFKNRRIHVAELVFDGQPYPVRDVIFTHTTPVGMDKDDRVIDLIMFSNDLSHDLVEWMARNGSTYPLLELNIEDGNKTHKIVNASPVNWNGMHITIVGGRDYDLEAKAMKLIEIKNEELALRAAERMVREMKTKDPVLARFEIELED